MRSAARVGDMHTCPQVTGPVPHVGGPILPPGCPTVLIAGQPAARVGDLCTCVGPPDTILMGSTTVLIAGQPAARLGDPTAHGGVIVMGAPNVLIGDAGGGGGGGAGGSPTASAGAASAPSASVGRAGASSSAAASGAASGPAPEVAPSPSAQETAEAFGEAAESGAPLVPRPTAAGAEATAKIGSKIAKQMGPRGWTPEQIQEAIKSGKRARAVNKATGNPATRYLHPKSGQSVVVDDVTREVIHVGGPGFKYGRGSGDLQ